MLVYKVDVLKELKDNGYSTYSLQKDKIISGRSINEIKNGKLVGLIVIDTICGLLKCQPGHIIKWVDESETEQPDDSEDTE